MNNDKQPWKVLSTENVSPSKWFPLKKDLVILPNGNEVEYFRSTLADVAMVLPITKDNQLIFVKQYKHGIGEVTLEFPAGRIEPSQRTKEASVRELREETGIVVAEDQLVALTELWTEPSKSSVRVHCFLTKDVEITTEQSLEETEQIQLVKVPLSELDTLIKRGQIHASDTLGLIGYAKSCGVI